LPLPAFIDYLRVRARRRRRRSDVVITTTGNDKKSICALIYTSATTLW